MEIRVATIEDASGIREVYAPYVVDTAVSFEYEIPSIEEMQNRIKNTLEQYPYLVAVEENTIVGYVYAARFHTREAYQHSVELSIYVRKDCRGLGIGRKLYRELEKCWLSKMYIWCMLVLQVRMGRMSILQMIVRSFMQKWDLKEYGFFIYLKNSKALLFLFCPF